MRYFCTYFDSGFLRRGMALHESLRRFCDKFKLFALCFDQGAFNALKKLGLDSFQPIALEDLLDADIELASARPHRTTVEFYFTTTPALPLYLLNAYPEIDMISYLDSDIFFYSSPEDIFKECGNASISIIGHRYSPNLKGYEKNGIYNVSWVSFLRDVDGLDALRWWRKKCLEWCFDRHEDGRYADQKYLDDWPSRFKNVHVIGHPGANLAPWNIENHSLSLGNGNLTVDGKPLIFYHFHGFRKIYRNTYDPNLSPYGAKLNEIIKTMIYEPYIKELEGFKDLPRMDSHLRGSRIKYCVKNIFWAIRTNLFQDQDQLIKT